MRVWAPRVRAGEQAAILIQEEIAHVSATRCSCSNQKMYVNNTLSTGCIPHEEERNQVCWNHDSSSSVMF